MAILKILQFNCGGCYSSMCDFGQTLCENGNVALLQEPFTVDNGLRGLPLGMRSYVNKNGDSAIVINDSSLDCILMESLTNEFGICMQIKGSFGVIVLVSIYCKFGEPIEPYIEYIDAVRHQVHSLPCIIGMDANASSLMWHSKLNRHSAGYQSHYRGELLSEYFNTCGIIVLNEPSVYHTFDGPYGRSDIDITIANSAAMKYNYSWKVQPTWSTSDHNVIEISMTHHGLEAENTSLFAWHTKNVNWSQYSERIKMEAQQVSHTVFDALPIDIQISVIEKWIYQVNDDFLKKVKLTKFSKVKWWNAECRIKRSQMRRSKQKLYRSLRRNDTDIPLRIQNFKDARYDYKQFIIKVKENEWRDFVKDSSENNPWSHAYKICRGKKKTCSISELKIGDTFISDWGECAGKLLDSFFPQDNGDPFPDVNENLISDSLEEREIIEGISRIKCRRSPGMDGITGEMLLNTYKAIPDYFWSLYKKCIENSKFPDCWKIARVIVLLKSPLKDKSNPKSYRGISLLPVFGKLFEYIMINRLEELVANNEKQFGFRRNKSTIHAWRHVQNTVSNSTKKYVLGIAIDFVGAFDNLTWQCIIEHLNVIGCKDIKLWKSYFNSRKAIIVGSNARITKDVKRGCPQGSICGPFMWNMIMDLLLNQLEGVCQFSAYADDLFIMVEADSRTQLELNAATIMDIIQSWSVKVGVEVSKEKTQMILLKGKLSLSHTPNILINNTRIGYARELKYLGITIGERMSFLPHFKHLQGKLVCLAGMMRRILRTSWGYGKRAVRIIYNGLLVPCATYGAPIWYKFITNTIGFRRLMACQRVCLLSCLSVCKTVSTDALQVLMGAAPLDLVVCNLAFISRYKLGIRQDPCAWFTNEQLRDSGNFRKLLKEKMLSIWQDRWNQSSKGRITFQFIMNVKFALECNYFKFSLFTGFLLTGHGSLNEYLHKRRLASSASCHSCDEVEDVAHVLCKCPLYDDFRNLRNMSIDMVNNNYILLNVLSSKQSFYELERFAYRAFMRRKLLVR